MKKIIYAVLALAVLMGLFAMPALAAAEEYISIKNYTEVFTPANETDGALSVTVTGTAGADGYLYLIAAAKGMEPAGEVTGENLAGTTLEAYSEGSNNFFRIAVADPAAEATVNATFTVPGFYAVSRAADTNGAEDYSLSYKFTNTLASKLGKYSVMVYVPQGMEIAKVSSPSKYEDYILAEQDGMRGAGNAKALAASAANTLTFTYDAAPGAMFNIIVWVLCLGIGILVFVDRYKKAMKE